MVASFASPSFYNRQIYTLEKLYPLLNRTNMPTSQLYRQILAHYPQLKYALLAQQTFNSEHFGFPDLYYDIMESDTQRIGKFVDTFQQYDYFAHQTVCEVGVGRLALSRHYLPYVKKAYLIESNPHLIPYLRTEITKMNLGHKVVLLHGDGRNIQLPEPIDALIGELMSIFCANELQVQVFTHLRQYLKKNGLLVPQRILNLATLCEATFEQGHTHYPINFSRHLPQYLSLPGLVNTIQLRNITTTNETASTPFTVLNPGKANAILLHSHIHLSDKHTFTGTDSLMPPTVVQLPEARQLSTGQSVVLQSHIQYGRRLEDCRFQLH